MSPTAARFAQPWRGVKALFHPARLEIDVAAKPSDGLVVFGVMWGLAMMLSAASHRAILKGGEGWDIALVTWGALGAAALLVVYPRKTWLLLAVAAVMSAQYALRLPVSSNNQTISLFMNAAIFAAVGSQVFKSRNTRIDREVAYEQLRVVARALLAIMYFYGIFHKINTGFLNPETSCATALYERIVGPLGLGQNIAGQYLAIAATFIIEGIAIVCLYWRRFFWVGLLVSLPFHYLIPISGYSWYMDFSALVFALYMLSVPREVSAGLYSTGASLLRSVPKLRPGLAAMLVLAIVWGMAAVIAFSIALQFPNRGSALIWHSAWLLVWSLCGGVSMVLIMRSALLELPYEAPKAQRQTWWVYAIPATLFLVCTSPYIGLKTESSIAMFSNLHTEGGVSNHLIFPKPPYLFDHQARATRVLDSSDPVLNRRAEDPHFGLVEHDIAIRLLRNPEMWITYEMGGKRFYRVTAASFTGRRPSWLEQKLLDFKPIDWARPKVCSH